MFDIAVMHTLWLSLFQNVEIFNFWQYCQKLRKRFLDRFFAKILLMNHIFEGKYIKVSISLKGKCAEALLCRPFCSLREAKMLWNMNVTHIYIHNLHYNIELRPECYILESACWLRWSSVGKRRYKCKDNFWLSATRVTHQREPSVDIL